MTTPASSKSFEKFQFHVNFPIKTWAMYDRVFLSLVPDDELKETNKWNGK